MLKIEKTEVVGWEAAIRGMRNPLESWERSDSTYCQILNDLTKANQKSRCAGCKNEFVGRPNCYIVGENDHDLMMRLRDAGTDHRKFMRFLDVYVDITAPLYWWKEFKTYRAGRTFGDDEPEVLPIPEDYLEFDIEMNSCSTMHKIHSKEFTLDDFSHEHLEDLNGCNCDDSLLIDVSAYHDDSNLYSPTGVLTIICKALNRYRDRYLETKDKKYWWQMIQLLPSSYNQKRTLKLTYEVLANMYKSRRNHKLDEWHTFCDWIESLPYSELITGSESRLVAKLGEAFSQGLQSGVKTGPYISQAPANCDIEKSEE